MLVETKREQVFQISPSVRVVADYEDEYDTIDQVARNIGLGVQTLKATNNFTRYSTDDDAKTEIEEIVSDGTLIEDAVSDYFTGEGIPFLIYGLKGFSQGEWHEMVIYSPDKTWEIEQLQGMAEYFDALFAGEVYRVSVEYAKVFTANDGETRTEWITDEDFGYSEVVEKLFTLNADWIKDTYGFEVLPEVEG